MSWVACAAGVARGDDPVEAAALREARLQLHRALLDLPIARGETLGAALRLTGAREDLFGRESVDWLIVRPAIRHADGTVEVRASPDPAVLGPLLEERLKRLGVAGQHAAACRQALASADAADRLTVAGLAVPPVRAGELPPGWQTLGRGAMEHARRAARLDGARQLVDGIGECRTTDGRSLSEAFADDPVLEARLLRGLPDECFAGPQYTLDRECRIDAAVNVTVVNRVLGALTRESAVSTDPSRQFQPGIIDEKRNVIRATGVGVLPTSELLKRLDLPPALAAPEWVGRCISATGVAAVRPGDGDRNAAEAAAVSDAEFDARRRLTLMLDELSAAPGRSIRDVILAHPDLADEVIRFVRTADRAGPPAPRGGGEIAVTLRLPLRRLWHLVRDRGVDAKEGPTS